MKYILGNKNDAHNFWMSYTDLILGLLVLFIVASIVYYEKNKDSKPYPISPDADMLNITKNFKSLVDTLNSIKCDSLEIDTVGGSIRIYANTSINKKAMLFQKDSVAIESNFKFTLNHFGKSFIRDAMTLKNVQEIRIEGHADSSGDFLHNLTLSSNRAISVYGYIRDSCGLEPEQRKFMEKRIIPVGYSFTVPIIDNNGNEDMNKSRRVEFRIIGKCNYTNPNPRQ